MQLKTKHLKYKYGECLIYLCFSAQVWLKLNHASPPHSELKDIWLRAWSHEHVVEVMRYKQLAVVIQDLGSIHAYSS